MKDNKRKYSLDELLAGVTEDNIHAEVKVSPVGSDLETFYVPLTDEKIAMIADETLKDLDRDGAKDK